MAFTINAFNHEEWQLHRLLDYGDFADMVTECNVGEDAFSGYGEWFYIPEEPLNNHDRVIYFGTWGNDHSPGASMYTHAEIFNMDDDADAEEFANRVQHWVSQPEYAEAE